MWDIIFVTVLLAGFQTAAVIWNCGRMPHFLSAILSVSAGAAACLFLTVLPEQLRLITAPVTGHAVYILSEMFFHRAVPALSAAALCLTADMLILPFAGQSDELKSYIVCSALVLLSLICCGLYARGGSRPDRLSSIREKSRGVYAVISILPLTALPFQLLILALCKDGSLALAGEYSLLIAAMTSAIVLQRLCAEQYTLASENSMLREWQSGAVDYMNTVRAQRHDFNIHLHAIDGMIENGKYEQCRRYVSDMVSDAGDVNDIMPVYDAMIGSMLYNMRKEARRLGSDIRYDIKYDMKNVVCSAFVCNRLIGNIIRNALDALDNDEAKTRGINVNIFRRAGNAVITVSNYFHGDEQAVLRAFEPGWSGKSGHEGLGLAATERTLKQYGGSIMAEWQDKSVTFIMHIPVRYLPEENSEK